MAQPQFAREPGNELELRSDSFIDGERMPKRHTGDGTDLSPALEWNAPPPHTQELVLICEDPDAPGTTAWVHWVAYRMDPKVHRLPQGMPLQREVSFPVQLVQGRNSWNTTGYRGPLPPIGHGWHRYFFRLYALDEPTRLPPGASRDELMTAIGDHILAQGELIGLYRR